MAGRERVRVTLVTVDLYGALPSDRQLQPFDHGFRQYGRFDLIHAEVLDAGVPTRPPSQVRGDGAAEHDRRRADDVPRFPQSIGGFVDEMAVDLGVRGMNRQRQGTPASEPVGAVLTRD